MTTLIGKMFTFLMAVENGEPMYLPLLTLTSPLEDFAEDDMSKHPTWRLVPIGKREDRYLMPFSDIQRNVTDYLRNLTAEGIFYYAESISLGGIYHSIAAGDFMDEIRICKRPEDVEKDIFDTSMQIVGNSLQYIESFEGWTRAGFPLYFKRTTYGMKSLKKRILTSGDYEDIKGFEDDSSENFFCFTSDRPLYQTLEDIFHGRKRKESLVDQYYVIDLTPDKEKESDKRYLSSKKAFIKTAIGSKYPSVSMTFRKRSDALDFAIKYYKTFPSGEFKVVEINQPVIICEIYVKGILQTMWK